MVDLSHSVLAECGSDFFFLFSEGGEVASFQFLFEGGEVFLMNPHALESIGEIVHTFIGSEFQQLLYFCWLKLILDDIHIDDGGKFLHF